MENVTLAVAKSYAEELLMGQGSIKGEDGKDGADGVDGFSPIIVENASNTDEVYKLDITTKDGTFTTTNLIGKQGIQGIQGERGEQGETGLQGQQGIQGVKGEKGDDGYPFLIYKQYEVGIEEFNEADYPEIGLMFMVHVWEEDKGYPVYRYTADGTDTPYSLVTHMNTEGIKGEKGDKGDTGEQGIAGLDGKDGKDGTTYTPSIGEVTTVDSTELASATVSIKEDTKEAVFNFAIPKGNKGLDSVQISDNETVENKTWSSQKTSDEIAKVETELNASLVDIKDDVDVIESALDNYAKNNIALENGTDLNTLKTLGVYVGGYNNKCVNLPSSMAGTYEFILEVFQGNGQNVYQRITERGTNKTFVRGYDYLTSSYDWRPWKELATMDKLGGLTFSVSGKTLTITNGTNTWTLVANS